MTNDAWFESIYLEKEQQELISWMVEGERALEPEQRGYFMLVETMGGSFLIHAHVRDRPEVRRGDLDTLAEHGLLRLGFGGRGTPNFTITPLGRRYCAEMKRREGDALETVESEVKHFLDALAFATTFPVAHQRWREAADKLWDADDVGAFTEIGHICREAMQAFAGTLVDRVGVTGVPTDPAKTVARIRAALGALDLGEIHREFLDALLAYWGTVSDLVQRQEHGAQKEGTALGWEDARRVVFHTAIVMYEIARTLDLKQV